LPDSDGAVTFPGRHVAEHQARLACHCVEVNRCRGVFRSSFVLTQPVLIAAEIDPGVGLFWTLPRGGPGVRRGRLVVPTRGVHLRPAQALTEIGGARMRASRLLPVSTQGIPSKTEYQTLYV
jgi:hypothetical protein